MNRYVYAAALVAAGMMGCAGGDARTESVASASSAAAQPAVAMAVMGPSAAKLATLSLARAEQAPDAIGRNGARLAGVLYGEEAPVEAFQVALAEADRAPGARHAALSWKPGLRLAYHSSNDDLLVLNEEVTRDTLSKDDVGARAAEALFRGAFEKLVAAGAVEASDLDGANVRRSTIMQGEGMSGQAPVERVKEYLFTVPRTIGGIEVFDAGVEVSVHRNGRLARIRTFGPVAAKGPSAATGPAAQAISQEEMDVHARAEYPKAEVKSLGLRYWLPQGGSEGLVEPRAMYFVAPISTVDGEVIHARGFFVAYSVTDAGKTALVWPRADPDAKGDPR